MNLWINDYIDLQGHDAGKLLSFSSGLHIVLEGEGSNFKQMHPIGVICGKCGKSIEGRNIYPAPEGSAGAGLRLHHRPFRGRRILP